MTIILSVPIASSPNDWKSYWYYEDDSIKVD